jgi:hypothetical protein
MMKHILVVALSATIMLISAVWAEEIAMKSIKVNLGFEKVPDVHTCEGQDISPKIEACGDPPPKGGGGGGRGGSGANATLASGTDFLPTGYLEHPAYKHYT